MAPDTSNAIIMSVLDNRTQEELSVETTTEVIKPDNKVINFIVDKTK